MKIKSLFSLRKWIAYYLGKTHGKNLSDEKFIKLEYYACIGKKLNLKNPQTFNEKLQWLKLYDHKPEYTTMVDKYLAKKYVADKIGEEYIIPTLGIYDHFDEIDFDALPEQFVLKCTHDSGGLVICRDKSKLDVESAKNKIKKSLKRNYFWSGREWPYKNVKPRIIAEEYMVDESGYELKDYKFFCFRGIPKFLYVACDMFHDRQAQIGFFDIEGNTNLERLNIPHIDDLILNIPDGCFYRVTSVTGTGANIIIGTVKLTIAGSGGSSGPSGPDVGTYRMDRLTPQTTTTLFGSSYSVGFSIYAADASGE